MLGDIFIRKLTVVAGIRFKHQPVNRRTKPLSRLTRRLNKRSKRRLTRFGIVAANLALVGAVGLFVVRAQSADPASFQVSQSQLITGGDNVKPLDSLSSADVAVHVARLTGLQESTAVVNKADTVNAGLAVASSDEQVAVKPQIVGAGLKSKKDIKNYVAVAGDTATSVAERFGVSADTVRLSNGLRTDSIPVGTVVLISPVNGIIYTVKAGDTPDSIASRYSANKDILIAFNDAEVTGTFRSGERIVIPEGVEPTPARGNAGRASSGGWGSGFAFGVQASYGGNGYDYGWCTWHAANRRIQIGRPIPNNLGNAVSWLSLARRAGLPTGDTPRDGAVLYHKNIGGLGHVAFVEKVNADGSALISDMNYPAWGRATNRTITPAEFGKYVFIY